MQLAPIPALGGLERAHAAINAAYGAIADDEAAARPCDEDIRLTRDYLGEARGELAASGHDGPDDAKAAARSVLPRLDHALALLDALDASRDPLQVAPLLDELGLA